MWFRRQGFPHRLHRTLTNNATQTTAAIWKGKKWSCRRHSARVVCLTAIEKPSSISWLAGNGSVARLARTDSERIIEDMKSCFDRLGVRLSGFIDLKGIAQWAKTMPIVVED